jgi:hypothetical protein
VADTPIAEALGGSTVAPGQLEAQAPPNPLAALSNNVTAAAQNGPTLSPSTAMALGASGGDVANNTNAVAAGQFHQAVAQAHDTVNQGSGGVLGDLMGMVRKVTHPLAVVAHDTGISTALGDVGRALNYPLSIAQHEYRYFHDVEARYGLMAAAGEALVVAGAGAATTVATGGNLALGMLGAEMAAGLMGQVAHPTSWAVTANGNTYKDPHTGDVVSFGRDIANTLHLHGPAFGTLSGVVDGIADLSMDPLANVGKVVGAARSADGLGGILHNTWHGYSINPENVDLLYNSKVYTGFRRAVDNMAGMNAAQIVTYSPQWARFLPIAPRLGEASTPEEVLQVFRSVLQTRQMQLTDTLPSMSFVTKVAKDARDAAMNFDGTLANNAVFGPARWMRRLSSVPGARYDPELRKFTSNVIDFDSTDGAIDFHRMLRYALPKDAADDLMNSFMYADPQQRKVIFQNGVMQTLAQVSIRDFERQLNKVPAGTAADLATAQRGKPFAPEDFNTIAGWWDYRMSLMRNEAVRKDLVTYLHEIMGNANPGQGGVYDVMLDGKPAPPALELDRSSAVMREHNAAVMQNQTGKGMIPSFNQTKRLAAELAGAYNISGKLDDFAYGSITQGIFKPLVLLSMSYANHIALAEIIPNALRLGLMKMVRSAYYSPLARATAAVENTEADQRELSALTWYVYRVLDAVPHNEERVRWLVKVAKLTESHMLTPGVTAGENWAKEISTGQRVEQGFRNFFSYQPMRMKRSAKDFALLNKNALGEDQFLADWQAALREQSRDPFKRQAATSYRKLMAKASKQPKMPKLGVPDASWYHGTGTRWEGDQLDPFYTGSGGGINLFGPGLYVTDNKGIATSYIEKSIEANDEDLGAMQAANDTNEVFKPPGRDPHVYGLDWTAEHEPHLLDMDKPLPGEVKVFLRDWVNKNVLDAMQHGRPNIGPITDSEVVNRIIEPIHLAFGHNADAGQVYTAIQDALRNLHVDEKADQLPELMQLARELHGRFGYDGLSYRGGKHVIGAGPEHNAAVLWPITHGDKATVDAAQATHMESNASLQDHLNALDELRGEKVNHPTDRADTGNEYADLAGWLNAKGGPRNAPYLSPETRDILAAHHQGPGPFAPDALDRLENETIPRLQGQTGQAEQAMEDVGGRPEFPVSVASHTSISPEQRTAVENWMASHMTQSKAIDQVTKEVADALRERAQRDPDWKKTFIRANLRSERNPSAGSDQFDDWARIHVEGMVWHSQDQPTLLDHIARGQAPSMATLRSIPKDLWPEMVKGRTVLPSGSSRVQRIADLGFRKMINPWVNITSRNRIFGTEFVQHMERFKPMIASGQIDEDEAILRSMDITTNHMIRFIHNLHDRTQWSETMRNWAPFFFAKEQAYKRMGRLLMEDPGAFRRYQMMISGVGHMAAAQHNGQGQGFYSFPGGTWLARGTTEGFAALGLPVVNVDSGGFDTTLSSANVIFPLSSGFRPDVSPIAALSAKALQGFFPEFTPALDKMVGVPTMSSGIINQLIPNTTVNRVFEAVQGGLMNDPGRAFASSMMQAMQLAVYQQNVAYEQWVRRGSKGPPPDIVPTQQQAATLPPTNPHSLQAFINRIKNQTMILYITNAALGFFSPTSPSVTVKDFGFRGELSNYISPKSKTNPLGQGSISKGMAAFLLAHPEATPYTVFQSTSAAGGYVPESVPGENWLNGHSNLMANFPNVTPYLMPNVPNGYSVSVYDEQLAQGVRVKRSATQTQGPNSFAVQLYVAAGNQVYYDAVARHEANLKAAGNSSVAKGREYTAWTQYLNQLQTQAPVWAQYGPLSNFKASQMRESINELRQVVNQGLVPDNSNARNLASLLTYFDQANQRYAKASETFNYSHNETLVRDSWKSYLDSVIAQHPELSSAVRAIFFDALGSVPLS